MELKHTGKELGRYALSLKGYAVAKDIAAHQMVSVFKYLNHKVVTCLYTLKDGMCSLKNYFIMNIDETYVLYDGTTYYPIHDTDRLFTSEEEARTFAKMVTRGPKECIKPGEIKEGWSVISRTTHPNGKTYSKILTYSTYLAAKCAYYKEVTWDQNDPEVSNLAETENTAFWTRTNGCSYKVSIIPSVIHNE